MLLRLRDGADDSAWSEFLQNYGPMLYRFVRSRGLQDADAADIVQDVMRRVGTSIGRLDYAKEKGGFRAWLFTITRNRLNTHFEKQRRQPLSGSDLAGSNFAGNDTVQYEMLTQTADKRDELSDAWDREHMRQLAARALQEVEPEVEPQTWNAFRMTAIENISASQAAEKLGMSTGAVYVAKSRVTARLRTIIERLQAEEE